MEQIDVAARVAFLTGRLSLDSIDQNVDFD